MKSQKSKYKGLQKRKAISGYLFIAPFIIGFLVFMIKPFFQSLYMSFCNVELGQSTFNMVWDGLANFKNAFLVDADFNRLLVDELTRMIIYSIAIMVFSFFVAIILNQEFKGRALVRAVFFLPVILSSGVMLGLESNNQYISQVADLIEESSSGINITGAIQEVLRTTGIGVKAFETVFEIIDSIYDVAMSSGMQIIIFMSGLQTISSSMYEAADIDGCTAWEKLWKITFPMVSSLLIVKWIYTVIDFCMRSDNDVIKKIQVVMIDQLKYGFASAMSWAYFVIVVAFIGITSFFISKGVYYND